MPAFWRSRRMIFGFVAAALITLGCVSAPEAGPAGSSGAGAPSANGTEAPDGSDPDGTDTPEEFADDVGDATKIAEEYWAGVFEQSGISFEPVSRVIPYEREGEVDCGGQPLGLNNAAYCSAGDFIAYDVNWAFAGVPAGRRRVHLLPARPRVRARHPAAARGAGAVHHPAGAAGGLHGRGVHRGHGTPQPAVAGRGRHRGARGRPGSGRRRPGPALVRRGLARHRPSSAPRRSPTATRTPWNRAT